MRLLIATSNQGKLRELRQLLASSQVEVVGLDQLDKAPVVIEDGATFKENAEKKALTLARYSGYPTLADDSGLCVDALAGAPGVYSARYAGAAADDTANNCKLLEQLVAIPRLQRKAHFHCSIALAWPDGRCVSVEGQVNGLILTEARGTNGFGYDPLFLVPEYGKTMAELPGEIKNRISHRAKALQQLLPLISQFFNNRC